MSPLASLQYLDSLINHEIHLDRARASSFKLERVARLLKELGDSHKDLKAVHVAGSKGKGSICAITASILQSAGYKVGLYTSPHLNNYRERIRILGSAMPNLKRTPGVRLKGADSDIFPDCIREEELRALIGEIKPAVEKVRSCADSGDLSFFEVYTVLALYYFYKSQVDLIVLETGLGGRLDATNAVDSGVAVIAPISLEHARILGDTIERIAEEKAGIIKGGGQRVVIAPQDRRVLDVLKKRCRRFSIDPLQVEGSVAFGGAAQDIDGQTFDLKTVKAGYQQIRLPLLGKHQRENAAVSVCVIECLQDLGWIIPARAVAEGCRNVFWPGRTEVIERDPLVLLDGAHNAASAKALSQTLREILGGRKVVLVLGVSKDKDKESICDELKGIARKMIFTKADHPRAKDLEGAVDVRTALDLARREAGPDGVILVAGSVFVVSEARRYLLTVE
ncbi:MAG: bifunctional folylpolyglutamate synthase/dihydrofolate synthase [Candidatus Omnitrophica bacterium]|nr:bifunctional folylpolyglutamate synthase/dihydrofolate synthase [Candidatus Omnitrophota bacterium]